MKNLWEKHTGSIGVFHRSLIDNIVGFLKGGALRIPREDWGTLGNISED